MKAIKRILATMMCLCLVFGCVSVTALAEEANCSITVENQSGTNASVAGKILNLFKIFSATSDGENISYQWVTEIDGSNRYEEFFFGKDGTAGVTGKTSGTIHDVVEYINGLKDNSFAFSQMAAKLHTYIHENGIAAERSAAVPEGSTYYTFDNLELGYYLIYDATTLTGDTPAVRSAAMMTHAGENKVIKLKADRPHIEKTVDDRDNGADTADWKLGTTASVGETVTFRIVTMIPNHDLYGDDYTFVITDKMADALELVDADEDGKKDIQVTVTEPAAADDSEQALQAKLSYSIETDPASVGADVDFKVTLNNITELQQDTVVEIIYKAKVTSAAGFKNINTAILTYSNDPHNLASTGSVEASASVMLWQFTLTKYLEDASGTPSYYRLGGAEFEIYSKNDLENPLKFITTELTTSTGVKYLKYTFDPTNGTVTTLQTLDTGDDGKTDVEYTDGGHLGQILIFGLGEGTYVIRETKAPAGYQVAKGDFEFTVTDTVGLSGTVSNATISEATRTEAPGQFTRVLINETHQKYYVGITNAPGSALPETGGMGTMLFTVIGVVLMAGALAFFTLRKRSSAS